MHLKMQPNRNQLLTGTGTTISNLTSPAAGDSPGAPINMNLASSMSMCANGLLRISDILRPRDMGIHPPHHHQYPHPHHLSPYGPPMHPHHQIHHHPGGFGPINMKASSLSPPEGHEQSPPNSPPLSNHSMHSPDSVDMKIRGRKMSESCERDEMSGGGKHSSDKGKCKFYIRYSKAFCISIFNSDLRHQNLFRICCNSGIQHIKFHNPPHALNIEQYAFQNILVQSFNISEF